MNGFSVSIPESQEETNTGYVILRHNQTFRIRLHNGHKFEGSCRPADAEVYLSGNHVGTFRVPYGQTITLERSVNDNGKFTAVRNGTYESQLAELDESDPDNGLIKVVWKPGHNNCSWKDITKIIKEEYPHVTWDYNSNHYYDGGTFTNCNTTSSRLLCSTRSCSSDLVGGGIGLSGHSNQDFSEVDSLNYDEPETTIYLRIAFRDGVRPLKSRKVYKTYPKKYCNDVPRPLR